MESSAAFAALGSAVAFGLCDFLAGLASRRLSYWWVAVMSLVVSATGAWVFVLASGAVPARIAVLWGLTAGAGAAIGSSALYRGYGHGQMAVAGPISAVGAVALPAVVGALLGERLPWLGVLGVLAALPAVWLVAGSGRLNRAPRRGSIDGLISGIGFALEFVGLDRAGTRAGLWPVAVSQTTALVLVGAVVLIRQPGRNATPRPIVWACFAGVLSLTATGLYFVAANAGLLTIAAVLAGLYPAVTVLLAALFLHERPQRTQILGLVLAGSAVVLIVLP